MATGLTALLAVMVLKKQHARRSVVAVPVCSPEAAERIKKEADELVPWMCLMISVQYRSITSNFLKLRMRTSSG